jgi:hypothetical protein
LKGNQTASKDFVSVFFYLLNNRPNYAAFELSIVDEFGHERYTKNTDHVFVDENGWGWSQFISRNNLFKKENGYTKDKMLTLTGKYEFINQSGKFVLEKLKTKASEEINNLFNKRSFTDLELKIKEKVIDVHKVVLAANSSVLAESLLKLGKNQNFLELDDLEFEVAEEMVNFIYDEKIKDIENLEPLLEVADRFKIDRLKVYCGKYFYENLNADNAIETLKLSGKCHAQELKNECIDFIRK